MKKFKKIFSIIACAIMLLGGLFVSPTKNVSALEIDKKQGVSYEILSEASIVGEWKFNDVLISLPNFTESKTFYIEFTYEYLGTLWTINELFFSSIYNEVRGKATSVDGSSSEPIIYEFNTNKWGNFNKNSTFTIIGGEDINNPDLISWFTSNATKVDGGDSGQPDMSPDTSATYLYNGLELPVLPDYDKTTFPYAFIKYNGTLSQTVLYVSNVEIYIDGSAVKYSDTGLRRSFNYHNDGWAYVGEFSVAKDETAFTNIDYVQWTMKDLYYKSGEMFMTGDENFILPLHQMIAVAVEGALAKLKMTMGGTITTLILCGVGCLALLMVLSLFGKVFQIFRVK